MNFLDIWNEVNAYYLMYKFYVRIALSIGIVLFALFIKQFIINYLSKFLRKLTAKTRTEFDDQLITVIEKPAKFAFIVIAIWLAIKILPLPSNIGIPLGVFMHDVTLTLILFALFWAGYNAADVLVTFVRHVTEKTGSRIDDMLSSFIGNSFKALVFIIGGVTIAQVWVEDIAGILTGLGLGGLAFALAAQDTAANLFGSVTIMLDKPFGIGDWISTPQTEGTVESIGFRSTRVRTFQQALVTIPNSTMSKEAVTNWSRMGKRRISFRLGVTYQTTNEQMKECVQRLRTLLEEHPDIHPETTLVYFERFKENSLEIFLYFFTKTTIWEEYLAIQEDINLKIMEILEELGIGVALPSRSVYLERPAER
jgi:MscS family membrane protein